MKKAVTEFNDWSKEKKIPLYFMILPHRMQLPEKRTEKILQHLKVNQKDLDFDKPSRIMRIILDEQKIPYLDATPLLRKKAAGGYVVGMGGDSHYNPKIHEFLGQALEKYIKEYLLKKNE